MFLYIHNNLFQSILGFQNTRIHTRFKASSFEISSCLPISVTRALRNESIDFFLHAIFTNEENPLYFFLGFHPTGSSSCSGVFSIGFSQLTEIILNVI